jgi:2-C-methyl-D-erythritol 2,4-cyclodiphosphate synthase
VTKGDALPRVGQGFDVHPFSGDPGRRLVLGGVAFDGPGLDGHSDADVVAHAVADALLGAAGMGDLGSRFPSTDPALAGANSMDLLSRVVASVSDACQIGNVDVTLIADAPHIAPRLEEMRTRLCDVVGAPVNVKPKRAEALGALGRREGIACLAVALVLPR